MQISNLLQHLMKLSGKIRYYYYKFRNLIQNKQTKDKIGFKLIHFPTTCGKLPIKKKVSL